MRAQGRIVPVLAWGAAILILWEAVSWYLLERAEVQMAQSKLPYVHEVLAAFGTYGGVLAAEGWITFTNAAWGFLAGGAAGALLAVLMSASRWMERLAFPYAVASQMVPILGLAPIVFGIVRNEDLARVLIAAYITFFPVALNMLRGLRSVSPAAIELMRACAASPWSVYLKLRLPASLPGLFSGLKIAAPLAVTGAILVELMGASRGIGVIMLRNLYYGPSHVYMFWSTVIVGALLGVASYAIVSGAERIVAPWQPEFRVRGGDG